MNNDKRAEISALIVALRAGSRLKNGLPAHDLQTVQKAASRMVRSEKLAQTRLSNKVDKAAAIDADRFFSVSVQALPLLEQAQHQTSLETRAGLRRAADYLEQAAAATGVGVPVGIAVDREGRRHYIVLEEEQ